VRGTPLDLLAYAAMRAVESLLLAMPPDVVESLARVVGRAWFRFDRMRRDAALENVRLAFPGLSPARRERIARDSFEHAFLVAVEVARRPRVVARTKHARRQGRFLGDQAAIRADVRAGRGGLLLGGHFGNWELAGSILRLEGVRFSAIARPIENPYVDEYVTRTRGGSDALIEKQGAVRSVSRALREGRWVGITADQNAGRHGIFVPFFGVLASTYPLAATLAVRHRVPVYFGAAIRRGSGFRYDYVVRRWVPPAALEERRGAEAVLAAFHAWLEEGIRAHPEQYFWLHRRWRSRPKGEAHDERLPAYARAARVPPRRLSMARHVD
jgi:KDO2-lipid IV(A) lauroyltransferase